MANVTLMQNSFAGGELSPLLDGRIDTAPYRTGARTMENFIPMRQGPVRRRPGTWHAGNTHYATTYKKARLVEFVHTDGTSWILEFTDLKCRIWNPSTHAIVGGGTPTVLTTTIAEAELFAMRYAMQPGGGEIWIAHPSHKVQKISYNGSAWSISEPTFTGITFSLTGDYPAVVGFHAGRLVLAATNNKPTLIWMSKAYDSTGGVFRYTDFTVGSTVDAAIVLAEADMGGTAIRWVMSAKRFQAATSRRTWAENSNSVPTPSGFDLDVVGYNGSANIQGQQADNILAYVSANLKALRVIVYSEESGGFQDMEVTKTCEHILSPGVVDLRVQTDPETILWLVRSDGTLVSIIIDLQEGMVAASRHVMGGSGKVESVAIARTSSGDEIWVTVLRGTTRTVEWMILKQDTDTSSLHYVDDGLHLTPSSKTVTGLSHLEGATVAAIGDGAVLPEKTVSSGSVTYDRTVADIHIGHPYHSTMLLTKPEVPANGTSQGKKKRVEDITLRLWNSAGGSVGQSLDTLEPILYTLYGTYKYGEAPSLFTGDKKMDMSGTIDEDANVYIVQESPLPFVLLAAMLKVAIMEV